MKKWILFLCLFSVGIFIYSCQKKSQSPEEGLSQFEKKTGLEAEILSYEPIIKGKAPPEFKERSGAPYKPSHNEDPAIPVQCWIETGYGTQNACKYCHTDYLADIGHGNSFPLAEDQILYSFPSPNLNRVNWSNIIYPQEISQRLEKEGISIPRANDPDLPSYVRADNWQEVYSKARGNGDDSWNNMSHSSSDFQLFPALNPENLYPYSEKAPTHGGEHGYIDPDGFVRDSENQYTGWRAINFFPYAIFTPLTGSVSGIYIRLPDRFMTQEGEMDIEIYKKNLSLLEKNIKNLSLSSSHYFGDGVDIKVKKGFYPVGTEFAHPLHYVDLNADGEIGEELNGVKSPDFDYEFPGTRSKRVKEIRYMYKWKDVGLEDIGEEEEEEGEEGEEEVSHVIGNEGKGWIDNDAGWILAAYIENRKGNLRPQTTEELLQCKGCHSSVGNTVDAVWSFERKLPGDLGWGEMDYGSYQKEKREKTRLHDYFKKNVDMGELEYFYFTVVGADLFGVMPSEIKSELMDYAEEENLVSKMSLKNSIRVIFDDEKLKSTPEKERKEILEERARIMRHYATQKAYLYHDEETGKDYIKGTIFYPSLETMLSNIAGYRRIVLDQSFNLGKNVFGTQPEAIPFTFRSDGTVLNGEGEIIPVGEVIQSRPWGEHGVGTTPTGIVKVNSAGEPVDEKGNVVDIQKNPQKVVGHVSKGGTFETWYNPIITGNPVKKHEKGKEEEKKKK